MTDKIRATGRSRKKKKREPRKTAKALRSASYFVEHSEDSNTTDSMDSNRSSPSQTTAGGVPAKQRFSMRGAKRQEYHEKQSQKRAKKESGDGAPVQVDLPQKRLYRQRAHANPFSDHNLN